MIFYYGANGELINKTPQYVFQGSSKANTIYFVCPTSPNNLINVAFRLPNGQSTPQALMTLTEDTGLSGVFDYNGKIYAMWKYDIPSAITTYAGDVKVQFYISSYGEVLSTETAIITVKKGVSNIEPEQTDTYQEVLDNIIRLYNDLNTNYQRNIDDNLNTEDKTFVGAINEINDKIEGLNIENLKSPSGIDTGSIRTKKSQSGHTNEGDGQFGAMLGSRLLMNTDNSLIVGQDNKADNFDGQDGANSCFIAGGNNNTVKGSLSSAIGHQLIVNETSATKNNWEPKLAVGTWNQDKKNIAFMVGAGAKDARKNAFEVYYDGHAEVEKQGTTENSVAQKKYVDDKVKEACGNIDLSEYQTKEDNSLETESKEIVGAINEVNAMAKQGAGIDLSEYVKFTDYPTTAVGGKAGVIKVDNYYGFKIGVSGSAGVLMPNWATSTSINNRSNNTFLSTHNLDYAVVKGLTTNTNTLTDEEIEKAQKWLGVKPNYKHLINFDFEHNQKVYKIRFEYNSSTSTPLTAQTFFNEAKNTSLLGIGRPEFDTDWLIMTMLYVDFVGGEEVIWFNKDTNSITSISHWNNFTDTVI